MVHSKNLLKEFIHYVIPSVISFALSGVYCIVDGYFIGNRIGDAGLAAINLAFPLTSFVQSLGTGIGMGGAIFYSIYKARHEHAHKNQMFWTTIAVLLVAAMIGTSVMLTFIESLLTLCGCSQTLMPLAKDYAQIILLGTIFQLLGTGLVPFIRNMGSASFAMIAMLAGFFANVGLDYYTIWILDWGLKGAAIASVAGQLITFIVCLIAIILNKEKEQLTKAKLSFQFIPKIISVGASPFGLTFIPNLSLLFINREAALFGGDQAVAIYSVISYVITVVYLLLQGISDGCQPMCSHYYGKQDEHSMHIVRRYCFIFSFIMALMGVVGLIVFSKPIGNMFGASASTVETVGKVMPIFAIGCFFVAISRTIVSYFYACTINGYASICIYGEAIIMIGLIFALPRIGNLNILGVWLATPLTQFIIMIISLILLKYGPKSRHLFVHDAQYGK